MKFLLVNKISPYSGGGAERYLRSLAEKLVQLGHQVFLVCGTDIGSIEHEDIAGVKIFYVKSLPWSFSKSTISYYLSRTLFFLFSFGAIYKVARQYNVDIIIDNGSPIPSLSYPVSRLLRKRCYLVVHEFLGLEWFRNYNSIIATIGFFSQFLTYLRFDRIIAVSEFTRSRLLKYGIVSDRIVVVPNTIELKRYKQSQIREPNSILTIGRLSKYKDQIYLCQAMKRVLQSVPSAKLYIVGNGPEFERINTYISENKLASSITVLTDIREEEKINMLSKCYLFVNYSHKEGFGITLLEAMASGLPIIAADIPPFREIITNGKNGYLVRSRDPESLAEKIVFMLLNRQIVDSIRINNLASAKCWDIDRASLVEKIMLLA